MQAEQQSERKRQAAIAKGYDKLHEGKLGAHWLWCVIEQIAAGVGEEDVLREFGYYTCAALSHPSPQWLPIESAPKDGTEIVGAEWQKPSAHYPADLFTQTTRYSEGAWRYPSGISWTPTHWMPLPPPPEQGSSNV